MAKDNGIARLNNGLLIPEETRDKLLKHDWSKPRVQGFNPNTATTKELEAAQFSGYRENVFTGMFELWCLGKVAAERKMQDVANNPKLMADMHEEAFATTGTVLEVPVKVTANRQQRRKSGPRRKR